MLNTLGLVEAPSLSRFANLIYFDLRFFLVWFTEVLTGVYEILSYGRCFRWRPSLVCTGARLGLPTSIIFARLSYEEVFWFRCCRYCWKLIKSNCSSDSCSLWYFGRAVACVRWVWILLFSARLFMKEGTFPRFDIVKFDASFRLDCGVSILFLNALWDTELVS